MTAVPRIQAVAMDCPDPEALASFYATLLDTTASELEGDWVWLDAPGSAVQLGFQQAPDFVAPTWPRPDVQQQLHIDFAVTDLDAAHDRAIALGARLLDTQPTFRVYADPVGHPFCLCQE